MSFSDDEAPPVGMYDYGATDHPILADAKVAAALAELRLLDRQEAVLRTQIAAPGPEHAHNSFFVRQHH